MELITSLKDERLGRKMVAFASPETVVIHHEDAEWVAIMRDSLRAALRENQHYLQTVGQVAMERDAALTREAAKDERIRELEGALLQFKQDHAAIAGGQWVPKEYYDDARAGLCAAHGGSALPTEEPMCKKCLQSRLAASEAQLCRAREATKAYYPSYMTFNGSTDTCRIREIEKIFSSSTGPCRHEEEAKRLREAVEKAACGPRLDPSKCSGCNGTGIGNCICGGMGTAEAERNGYKVAALERLLDAAKVSKWLMGKE
jgi:hypothetical protein